MRGALLKPMEINMNRFAILALALSLAAPVAAMEANPQPAMDLHRQNQQLDATRQQHGAAVRAADRHSRLAQTAPTKAERDYHRREAQHQRNIANNLSKSVKQQESQIVDPLVSGACTGRSCQ
jgi:hypothetical protein